MPVVVVGGSERGVGKTALVCGLIAALPEFGWTAVKVTDHPHGSGTILEEREVGPHADTGRYLAAGARRAYLVVAAEDGLSEVPQRFGVGIDLSAPLIFESNRIVDYCQPDVCLAVDAAQTVHKLSFARLAACADAMVMRSNVNRVQRLGRPIYHLANMERISPELLAWMRSRLAALSTRKMGM